MPPSKHHRRLNQPPPLPRAGEEIELDTLTTTTRSDEVSHASSSTATTTTTSSAIDSSNKGKQQQQSAVNSPLHRATPADSQLPSIKCLNTAGAGVGAIPIACPLPKAGREHGPSV